MSKPLLLAFCAAVRQGEDGEYLDLDSFHRSEPSVRAQVERENRERPDLADAHPLVRITFIEIREVEVPE